jgi:superfamily II DNA helicase RecQ
LSPSGNPQDQIGIPTAYLTSTCTVSMVRSVFDDLSRGRKGLEPFIKLLYVTPERIVNGANIKAVLQDLYQNDMLARFIIDEAHCVSSWGHDFRKDYRVLGLLKEEYPTAPIVALTATARPKVAEDIIKSLNIPTCSRITAGFDRSNLLFEVHPKPKSTSK